MHAEKIQNSESLLGPADPPPYQIINQSGPVKCLVIADHAGNAVPASLRGLGLKESIFVKHFAVDIGTRATATLLAARLSAPLILANYSRLVIDLNRNLDDPTAFITSSDGVTIPGNQVLGAVEKQRRCDAIYRPYHDAVDEMINDFLRRGCVPAIISVHSFTPELDKQRRPWHIGVLWDKDTRIAFPLLAKLRQNPELIVGDNEPYSGRHTADYTIDHHAEDRDLANVSIELRQDLLGNKAAVDRWTTLLVDALSEILADDALYQYRYLG